MRIAVNLLPFRARLAGAGRYTENVLNQLACSDQSNQYLFFLSPSAHDHFPNQTDRIRRILCPISSGILPLRIFWEQCILPWQLRRHQIDLLFTPSVAIPLMWPGRKVTVIYDMIAYHPEVAKYPPWRNAYVRWATRTAAWHSDVIVTISTTSQREIARLSDVPATKIKVAPPAVSPEFQPVREAERLAQTRRRYHLPDQFILFLGTLEPGKNLVRLIQAFAQLKQENPNLPHHLILAGERGWGTQELATELTRHGSSEVHLTGFVAEQDLPALYSAAELFVYPSLYEGFGVPPLEAMACGTPVITSNVSAMPEAMGGAALLVSPTDVSSLKEAMRQVLRDLALRETLITAGLERTRAFDWRQTAAVISEGFSQAFSPRP